MAGSNDTIRLEIINKLQEQANVTKGRIDNANLSDTKKSNLLTQIKDIQKLLSDPKGVNFDAVAKKFQSITQALVKAAGASETFTKKINALEQQISNKQGDIKGTQNALSKMRRQQIKQDEKGNWSLRESEANRLVAAQGTQYKTWETVLKHQDDPQAVAVKQQVLKAEQDYIKQYNNLTAKLTQQEQEATKLNEAMEKLSKEASGDAEKLAAEIQSEGQKAVETARRGSALDPSNLGKDNEKTINDIQLTTAALNKQQTTLGKVFKQFSLYSIGLRTVRKGLMDAVRTIRELDRYLTEQAMVTGKTRQQTYQLLQVYQDLAIATGATTKEVAEIATQFMRQGKTAADALTLTEAAISAAKVAGIGVSESVDYLTTALNGFQISANDAMKVSDKFASVAASSATSYEEIATALSKVAAQANLAGMSIDYTTALLAKGIETTREAPETIGTALKTIIARMREMSDYGETLEGDTDVNNVETQLSYVGIALKNANGELRSTEEVLDKLGHKWDTLNSNQQAAIAKALAGTRQQSRLIAMMTDYERVTELQQISARSAGATLSQMSTYMEGMDAAMNKVSVAWEKIVTAIADNEVIINIVGIFGSMLDSISALLSQTALLVPLMVVIGMEAFKHLGVKLQEQQIAREQAKIASEQQIIALEKQKTDIQDNKVQREKLRTQLKQNVADADALVNAKEKYLTDVKDAKLQGKATDADIQAAEQELKTAKDLQAEAVSKQQQNEKQIELDNERLRVIDEQIGLQKSQLSNVDQLTTAFTGFGNAIVAPFRQAASGIRNIIKSVNAAKAAADQAKVSNSANSAAVIPVVGWIIAAVIEGSAIITMVVSAISSFMNWLKGQNKSLSESVKELSNEIYKLTTLSTKFDSLIDSYDAIDKKIIKTAADQEELNKLLEQAADSLEGDEADAYKQMTNDQKIAFLRAKAEEVKEEADKARQKQLRTINNASASARNAALTGTSSDDLLLQASIYAINNNNLYKYIDLLKESNKLTDQEATSIEALTTEILNQVDAIEALNIANNPDRIKRFITSISGLTMTINKEQVALSDVLTSDSYSLRERIDAYRELYNHIAQTGDMDLLHAFESNYSSWATISEKFSETSIDFLNNVNLSIDGLNNMGKTIQELGYSLEESVDKVDELFQKMSDGTYSLYDAITETFAADLGSLQEGSEEWLAMYNKILNSYSNAIGVGILNMGQNMDKFKNSISNFYETANKWNEMNESEKTDFLSQNSQLFAGPDGQKLLAAFNSGNYNEISKALAGNSTLQNQLTERLREVENEIAIEEARIGDAYNAAYIQQLKEYKKFLESGDELFMADLDLRLEQQKNQIDEYKSMLQEEQDALSESLEKRKEAYSKYFDAINQKAEDQDYEDKSALLIANLTKLSSSSNADALMKSNELRSSLEDLEKERLETLRDRAQQQIQENIENEIEQINDKFDKLLESEQALLAAMNGDLNSPSSFLGRAIGAQVANGNDTALGIQSYIQSFAATYGMLEQFAGMDWDQLTVKEVGNQTILNIAGTEVVLSESEQQTVAEAIGRALKQIGYR